MFDFDLAQLYQVETRVLNQAVKRNRDLFPADFMFRISNKDWKNMSSQFVMTSLVKRPKTALPLVFTEHGVAMLANILKSTRARRTSLAIIRAFIAMKKFILNYKDLSGKLKQLEKKYNKQFADVNQALEYLLNKDIEEKEQKYRKRIGY